MVKLFHDLRERLLRAGIAPRHVRRYLAELSDHFADLLVEEQRAGLSHTEAASAALARLGGIDELTVAMIAQPRLRSWSARAPWAVFGIGAIFALVLTWLVAFFVLWTGWRIFLPGVDTPFGASHVSWMGNIYFQFGRMIYFSAPIIIGWCIAAQAARQRLRVTWPIAGLVMIAFAAGTAQVQASRSAIAGGLGHIQVTFALGQPVYGIPASLIHALMIFSLAALPYLLWRWRAARIAAA